MSGPYYTIAQAGELVAETFLAAWGATTVVTLDNELGFAPPAPTVPPATPAAFVRLTTAELDSVQDTLGPPGAREWKQTGLATMAILVQLGAASSYVKGIAEQARRIFLGVDLGNMPFFKVDVTTIGPDGKGFHQTNVSARFRYYQRQ